MARPLVFDLITRDKSFSRGLGQAEKKASGFQRTMGRLGSAAAGALAGGAIISGVKTFTDAAKESRAVARQTEAAIRSTGGAANISAGQVGDLAGALSKKTAVDDEVIASGANLLLTFTNVRNEAGRGNDVFNQATAAAVDMAAAMNQGEVTADGLKSANIQLGKALNDPIKGISALSRVGVSFTEQQKAQIATMVKAGDTAGAQKLILAELRKEFGGSAAAAADSGKKLQVAWGNAQETLGGLLLPAIERGQKLLVSFVGWVDRNRGAATALGGAVVALTGFVLAMSAAQKVAAATQAAIRGATLAWAAAQKVLNFALAANPIGLVITAVALLVAGIVLAYKRSETFRRIVDGVWAGVKRSVGAAVNFIIDVVRGWLNVQIGVVEGILHVMGKLPGPMGAPFRKAEEAVKGAKATINTQMDKIQARINRLTGKDVAVTASTSLHFTKSFSQKDWLAARLAAGRMATGGPVYGQGPRGKDSELRWLAPGEHVWTDQEVLAAGGHRAMERWRKAVLRGDAPGLARGGPVLPQGIADTGRAHSGVAKIEGNWVGREMVKGIKALQAFAPTNIPHTPGSWKIATDYLSRLGIPYSIVSTFRPGARTHASGRVSFHALNRAVDLDGGHDKMAIWSALTRTNPTELIYSRAPRYKSRSGWHPIGRLDPITRADHYSHVHAAYGKGGLIPEDVLGVGRSGRTYGFHGGETVVPKQQPPAPADVTVNVTLSGAVMLTDQRALQQLADKLERPIRTAIMAAQRRAGRPYSAQLR